MGGIPGIIPPHKQLDFQDEMGRMGYDPQTHWDDYTRHCRETANSTECPVFSAFRDQLKSDGNSPMEQLDRFFGDPRTGIDNMLNDAKGGFSNWIDRIRGGLSDAYNSFGYDGWKPESNDDIRANANRIMHQFLSEAAYQRVSVDTMEKIDQLKALGHRLDSTTQFYVDRIEADPAAYGLGIETNPGQLEAGRELGNLGNVYTEMKI